MLAVLLYVVSGLHQTDSVILIFSFILLCIYKGSPFQIFKQMNGEIHFVSTDVWV